MALGGIPICPSRKQQWRNVRQQQETQKRKNMTSVVSQPASTARARLASLPTTHSSNLPSSSPLFMAESRPLIALGSLFFVLASVCRNLCVGGGHFVGVFPSSWGQQLSLWALHVVTPTLQHCMLKCPVVCQAVL